MKNAKTHTATMRDEGARESLIAEDEFVTLLAEPVREFFAGSQVLPQVDPSRWGKRQCSLVAEKADEFESFLDDHEARHNRRFAFLVELVASIRGFAAVAHLLHHIRIRFPKYRVGLSIEELEEFQRDLRGAQAFCNQSLESLLTAMVEELGGLGIAPPEAASLGPRVGEESMRRHLPHDIDLDQGSSGELRVAAVLTMYLQVMELSQRGGDWPEAEDEQLVQFAANRYDETKARGIESLVHNIQSAYDTHLKFTALEAEHPDLRVFRGHISLALHLLEVGTLLIHFYERHDSIIQHGESKERIALLIPQDGVLRHAILFALFHAWRVLGNARPLVDGLLPKFMQVDEVELEIPDGGILHARPLSLIVNVVRRHGTTVDMVIDGDSVAANSIMSLIIFAGRHPGARNVVFRGDRLPLDHLRLLFEHGLGERGMDQLPDELAYLRA